MHTVSVLTGDLIGSTLSATGATDLAMAALGDAAAKISRITGTDARFTRFRGDGWQIALPGRAHVLRACLILIGSLRASGCGLATRLSVGVGPVDHLGTKDLSDASGLAFTLSGRNLDAMSTQTNPFRYADDQDNESWRGAVLDLALWQARLWSPEQAEAAVLALTMPHSTDTVLAGTLGISRQAFQSRLKGSGLSAQTRALSAFETPLMGARDE